jgi:ParB-like chromosome segregation protein Spo0J
VKEIRLIKIESILWDKLPINPSVLELVDFLREGGKIPPIKLQSCSKGGYKLRDGRHRIAAFKLLGIKEIEARFSVKELVFLG